MVKEQKQRKLVVEIPADLHQNLKVVAVIEQKTVREVIIALIRDYITGNNNE